MEQAEYRLGQLETEMIIDDLTISIIDDYNINL